MNIVGASGICRSAAALIAGCSVAALAGSALAQPAATPAPVPSVAADWSERAKAFSDLEWITRPSRDATMSFTIAVEVRELPVRPGDRVKKGDILIRARDGDAVAALVAQQVRVDNLGPLNSAQAAVDSAQVRYDRILEAKAENATNPQEVDDRRVQLAAAKAQLLNAQNDLKEEAARLKQLEESLVRYRLEAPFDGVVESLIVEVGSSIEPPNPVLRIVNIDTLWIDLPTPTDLTLSRKLKSGDPAWVMLDVPGGKVMQGKVLYVSPVADAAAATRRVRVEVPNPDQYPPGTRARVRFDRPEGAAVAGTPVAQATPARRGVVPHPGAAPDHDLANCIVCAKAAWEALKNGEDPAAAVRRAAGGRSGAAGVTK